jgi:hypothetical protein
MVRRAVSMLPFVGSANVDVVASAGCGLQTRPLRMHCSKSMRDDTTRR